MEKKAFAALLALLLMVCLQSTAFALELKGRVKDTDALVRRITIVYTDPQTQTERYNDIFVTPDTIYTGIEKFNDLQPGVEIMVDVSEDASHGWVANAIKVETY